MDTNYSHHFLLTLQLDFDEFQSGFLSGQGLKNNLYSYPGQVHFPLNFQEPWRQAIRGLNFGPIA